MQEAIGSRRNVPEDALIRYVGTCRIRHHIEGIQDPSPVRENTKETLALAATFGANEIRQTSLRKKKM
ncbi:hypothetical protein SBA3_2910013 [Candidatus Sulfopaludibacter sp. SbA3]|nr:hypothetical protein SBA3_2910013 [Candidatus Sulfopaludibacter sp. SbA3]